MADGIFRIHPAIGVARVGNSDNYVIAPETMAGRPVAEGSALMGGLPIRAGTEAEPVRSEDLRDASGALKRHAARFRIFHYPGKGTESYPRGDGAEITVGSKVGGRTVTDIVWTVHVANKKANAFVLVEDGDYQGIAGYEDGRLPPIRNAGYGDKPATQPKDKIAVLNDPARVRALTIDPGPRTISGSCSASVHFDRETIPSYVDDKTGEVVALKNYPASFPGDSFAQLDCPAGAIDTLGELQTDDKGRLHVLGGYGRACGWKVDGAAPLPDDVNNDQWFDDTSDGPVYATLVFDDKSRATVQGAWVTTTDPSFAPQILNVVSLWDDVYDVWVRELGLAPDIYDASRGGYQEAFQPFFDDHLSPVFRAASLQGWVTNLSEHGMSAHRELASITAADNPATTSLAGITAIFRDPFQAQHSDTTLMPLHLGDANQALLTLRQTQYFFLRRWNTGPGNYRPGPGPALGPGEYLDKATMVNCLGGRFSPGIDLTFVMREPALYVQPWRTSGQGPFRVRPKRLDYARTTASAPLLTGGYIPRHVEVDGLEPGDLSKWMAVPWHTDYNSCATHPPSPNPPGNRTLFWSWPAQRPVAVYTVDDVTWWQPSGQGPAPQLGKQRWSVRGAGTDSARAENWGRYQPPRIQIVQNWQRIGTVLQGPAITTAGTPYPDDWYLEVQSQLVDTDRTPVVPFPNYATEINDISDLDERMLFYQLFNVDQSPGVLADARQYVDYWLRWSDTFARSPETTPADQLWFPYTEQAFQDRLDLIYQELVDAAATSDPAEDPVFKTYDDMVTRTIQLSPFNLTDGGWLRNIGVTGPIDEVRSLLYSISMDELGDGDVSRNHCNIYRDLCHSIGYYPAPVYTKEFAFDPQLLRSAFTVPAFEMAISQFTEEYYPEILGMTLQLEWEVVDLKPTRDLLDYFGIDSHFYVMHIGIDNAVNGHGQRAADAVKLYLQGIREFGGEEAVQAAWRRIWNGFVAFGNIGNFGNDLVDLITRKPTLREQMIAMIAAKADFGSRNHQEHMVGPSRIDEWFADPPGFLDALLEHGWITPGDWQNSRMHQLMSFETGPMFRVFTDDEIALWSAYTMSLTQPPAPPAPPEVPAARAMAAVIDQLRPVQRGISGHATNTLADPKGQIHPLSWWFEQSTEVFMAALAAPDNAIVVPGQPGQSRFVTELIAPTGPMGSVFNLPADPPNTGTCRDVVLRWITARCPLPAAEHRTLRLTTPRALLDRHPTGRRHGMATVH
ncbi:MAG TPA: LodA/GoxA family CTQ-dependent oxidase [Rugosimonospora sp.]|nr:LodA/GoxA family CTQ-dependent oxidase [Rugosimonospora sp.]